MNEQRLELQLRLRRALDAGDEAALHRVADRPQFDAHQAFSTLLEIYDLWRAPIEQLDGRERFQSHPAVAQLKAHLEEWFVGRLDDSVAPEPVASGEVVPAMRRIAAEGLVPPVYEWLAETATWPELVSYLALEGGPDADFDDLVASAQVGLTGDPKLTLAENYWDEMGRGDLVAVHTQLHHELVEAARLPSFERGDLPVEALQRSALNGLVVTNRHLQPESLGALGLLEMQAGPRCRAVLRGLERLHAPDGAVPFYAEHASADPLHGRAWLQRAITPLAADPRWASGMIRGARWRSWVNAEFFDVAWARAQHARPGSLRAA